MNPDFERVKALFLTATEKRSPEERSAFLTEACGGDDALRAHVEVLLHAHDDTDGFLKPPAIPTGTVDDTSRIAEGPGTIIGPYKLLQEIGEGGMGAVFLAEQNEPVRRKVALKIIKPGLDSAQVIARFEAERQALAMMDHPNIAKVLDAGTTASGRPYFVMELVKGASITTYCDESRLTPRERLELFIPVCQAIQHAHQKGVIHRDIKPSNVLVANYDGKPVPKVIDFGIAKATDQPLTEKTLFTRHGQIVGTFEYMSPEQATLDTHDVDTRSDIYSLGVLLYELLTGTTPLDKERLRQAALLEVLRLIREEEPPRPSSRLSESRGALLAASVQRQTDADKLLGLVTGELDWIVMKSLDKDRMRRYATAAGLALDVEHYLKDEQVEACPPTAGYRLRKFVRRHRGPVLTAATVLVAVLAGIVGTSWGLVEALSQRDDAVHARKEEEKQRRLALLNAADAKASELKARAEERKAKEARTLADQERSNALFEKQQADQARQKAEWRLYAVNIAAAQREWETHNVALFYHYLNQGPPDFRSWEHDYLYTRANHNHQTLKGHTASLYSVAFSPNGKLLASASSDKTVILWDAASRRNIRILDGHNGSVRSVAFSPDGEHLATAAEDGTLKLWEVASGKNVRTFQGHTDRLVTSVTFSPDGKRLASGAFDATVKLWDVATGECVRTLEGHKAEGNRFLVDCVTFSPDGKLLASSATDMTVRIWNATTGEQLHKLTGHTGNVRSVVFSPDGKRLASAGGNAQGGRNDKSVKVWDATSGKELLTLKGHADAVQSVAFSPDGKLLASASRDKTVVLWDAVSGQELRSLGGHTAMVVRVAFSPDGKHLASASFDKTVKLWPVGSDQEVLVLKGGGGCVAFSPDGKLLASARLPRVGEKKFRDGAMREVKCWDAASGKEVLTLNDPGINWLPFLGGGECVAFSPDGKRLAANGGILGAPHFVATVQLWNANSGQKVLAIEERGIIMFGSLAFSPDGKHLATASMKSVKLWDAASGHAVLTFDQDSSIATSVVAFSPDSKRLATSSNDGTVKLWDPASGKKIMTIKGHSGAVKTFAFSPDGKRLASASGNSRKKGTGEPVIELKVWDAATGHERLSLEGHTDEINSVVFSPDGKRLATASSDNTVKLWDADSGEEVLTLRGHTSAVKSVAFSPDGKRLASASDGTIMIWNASNSMPEARQK